MIPASDYLRDSAIVRRRLLWAVGMVLLLDLMQYTLFGQQAIGKALIALVVVGTCRRLRPYAAWQQCVVLRKLRQRSGIVRR